VLGAPIAVSLLVAGLSYLFITGKVDTIIAAQRSATGLDSFPLLAIPFFMLAGNLMNKTGVTARIFNLARALVGHIPGALGHVNVLASMIFAGMSGSAVADAAGLGAIEIKAMTEDGYDKDFSAAITAASATIGPIIPPSISFVVYGLVAGVSIGGMFLGGFIPGCLMGLALMITVFVISRKKGYKIHQRPPLRETFRMFIAALPALLVPVLIVGGILGGIFTPTEAGAFAVLYTLIIGMVYKEIRLVNVPHVLLETALTAGNTLFIIAITGFISWILTLEQVPILMAEWITKIAPHPTVFLLLLNLILLFLGCFLAAQPVIIMFTPIILPVAKLMGISPIHLGVVMVLNLMIGLITPPVGLCLYIVSDISELPVLRVVKALIPFMIPLICVLLLITYFPGLVLFLPKLFGYSLY
jgi:tripartite ATP-independent transporter DctM subunit